MTTEWTRAPLWTKASETRFAVDPSSIEGDILHYSIPSVEASGNGRVEAATDAQSTKLLLRGGEILISKLNPRKSRVVIAQESRLPILASPEFVSIRPGPELHSAYLAYFLMSETTRAGLSSQVQSVTRSHQRVTPEQVMHLYIPIPPLDSQIAIAAHLDVEIAEIDKVLKIRTNQFDRLEELARSSIDQILATASGNDVRLGYIALVQSGLTVDAGRKLDATTVTRPYLRVANVQDGRLDLTEVVTASVSPTAALAARLRVGDVLMTEGGDLDKLGRGTVWRGEVDDCLHQNHVFAVRPDDSLLNSDYLAITTRSSRARAYFERTGIKTTNLASTSSSKIKDFRVTIPSLEVQRRVVREVTLRMAAIDRVRSTIDDQSTLLRERKQALITAAVTGQIDVTTARGVDV